MKRPVLSFLVFFLIAAGMWLLIEYADDKQLSREDFWYALGFGLLLAASQAVAQPILRWWEARRAA